jgi:hypothetical protein
VRAVALSLLETTQDAAPQIPRSFRHEYAGLLRVIAGAVRHLGDQRRPPPSREELARAVDRQHHLERQAASQPDHQDVPGTARHLTRLAADMIREADINH